ncbi:MAG: LptE family protein [Candidatus Eisenbacteria bacterium]
MEPNPYIQAPRHEPGQAPVPDEALRHPAPGAGPLVRLIPGILLIGFLACGYGVSGKTNPHIKTIAVPIFQNDTLEKGIEETLTAEIIDVLQENRTLTLTQERNADSVLLGRIVDYKRTPYSYDTSENVQEYKVDILIAVEYEDRKKRKTLWKEDRMHQWATYFVVAAPGHDVEEEEDAQLRAIQKFAQDIKTKTVEGW